MIRPPGAQPDRLWSAGTHRASSILERVSQTQPFALAVDACIRIEAASRLVTDRTWSPLRPLSSPTAARRERAARAERAAGLRYDLAQGWVRSIQLSDAKAARLIHWREAGDGPPLVLINGWSVSGLAWPETWLRQLESQFRVIRVDNRGTGWSRFAPSVYSIADLANDVVRVMDAIGVERARILGLSMGGMIAEELAMRRPERVEHLFIVASRPPAPRHIPAGGDRARALMMAPAAGVPLHEHVARLWAGCCAPGFMETHPTVLQELAAQVIARPTPRVLMRSQLRAILGWGGADRLRQLAVPTTVVHGDLDELIPVGNGMRLAQVIPGARYIELAGVGHLVPHEAPAELAALIEETLIPRTV